MTKGAIALIGYGRFGRLIGHYLKRQYSIGVFDIKRSIRLERGMKRISLSEAASRKIIILAIPIHTMPLMLSKIAPLLSQDSLIIDVCSVKHQPIRWMKSLLPRNVSILGTHPLFGPDSTDDNLRGKYVIVCPVRITRVKLDKIKKLLHQFGIIVRAMQPNTHDRLMASSLFLTQLIGRSLHRIISPPSSLQTKNTLLLHHIISSSKRDSAKLFSDMYRFNPYAHAIPSRVIREIRQTRKRMTHL